MLAGDIDNDDIAGNVGADLLANEGRELHDDVTPLLQLSQDRINVTTLIQQMLLHILTDYVETAPAAVQRADEADSALMESINNAALHEADQQFDYDPFAEPIHQDGGDEAQEHPIEHDDHASEAEDDNGSITTRYLTYP